MNFAVVPCFSSSDINLFKITAESSVAAGVRRLVALTSEAAFLWLRKDQDTLDRVCQALKLGDKSLASQKVESLIEQEKV